MVEERSAESPGSGHRGGIPRRKALASRGWVTSSVAGSVLVFDFFDFFDGCTGCASSTSSSSSASVSSTSLPLVGFAPLHALEADWAALRFSLSRAFTLAITLSAPSFVWSTIDCSGERRGEGGVRKRASTAGWRHDG